MNTGSAHACGVLHGWAGLPLLALGGFHWIHSPWVSVARVARTATLPRPNPWNASLAASSLQTTSPSPGWCPKSKPGNGAFRSCGPVGDLYNTFLLKESKKRNGSQMLLSCLFSNNSQFGCAGAWTSGRRPAFHESPPEQTQASRLRKSFPRLDVKRQSVCVLLSTCISLFVHGIQKQSLGTVLYAHYDAHQQKRARLYHCQGCQHH